MEMGKPSAKSVKLDDTKILVVRQVVHAAPVERQDRIKIRLVKHRVLQDVKMAAVI